MKALQFVPFNITLEGPFPVYNDDGTIDTSQIMFIAATTQFASNICVIEQAPDATFNFAVSATWGCYFLEQQVGGVFILPISSPEMFYRAVNTPCDYVPPTPALKAFATSSKQGPRTKQMMAYRTKDRLGRPLKLGQELPKAANVRRFILIPAT